jgi:uncharacterized repeat protein (TIGR03803 family)
MKSHNKHLFLLSLLTSGLVLMLACPVPAQTFTTLHSFTSYDGDPQAGLILSGGTLYGTAQGSFGGNGTVFAINTNGTGFGDLYSFSGLSPSGANSDGAYPRAQLVLSGNTLYGTAWQGGSASKGTVFAVSTNGNGTGFTNLHNFVGYPNDGSFPQAELILSSNTLYGTSYRGGSSRNGTLFAIRTDGTGFTLLYSFTGGSDGANPQAALLLSGNTLYGTATLGGSSGSGTVFAINTNSTGFTNLHSFTALSSSTNSDGATPQGALLLSGKTLYGTASVGGSAGNGSVFAVNIDGTGFTNLHSFTALSNSTNSDGANPQAGLILSGNTLYGTTAKGGGWGNGTVFTINTNGMGFTNLHTFTADPLWYTSILGPIYTNSDGASPQAALILSGNTLYGTATAGGSAGAGTVFSLSLGSVSSPTPLLTFVPSARSLILAWPTNATGFTLQSTTNLVSPVWTTNSPAPIVVNGQYTVTNPIVGTQQFFRLSQ